jgi:hypothetical protein
MARSRARLVAVIVVVVGAASLLSGCGSAAKPSAVPPSQSNAAATKALRAAYEKFAAICGSGGGPSCVRPSDLSASVSSATVRVQTGWADTARVKATATNGGEASPGDVSLAAQACILAESAAMLVPSLAAGSTSSHYSVHVSVFGQHSSLLAWSNPDGSCSS